MECIGKGKALNPYEFGVKISLAVTHRHGLMVGARSFAGYPYDDHTLAEQLGQTNTLLRDIGVRPTMAVVDLGFRGVDARLRTGAAHSPKQVQGTGCAAAPGALRALQENVAGIVAVMGPRPSHRFHPSKGNLRGFRLLGFGCTRHVFGPFGLIAE